MDPEKRFSSFLQLDKLIFHPCAGKETYCTDPCARKETHCTDPCAGNKFMALIHVREKNSWHSSMCREIILSTRPNVI